MNSRAFYGLAERDLVKSFREQQRASRRRLSKQFAPQIQLCETLIQLQYELTASFAGLLQVVGTERALQPLFYAFHGNLFHYFASLELSRSGLPAQGRVVFRPIFEGLLIAKFSAVHHETTLLERWQAGKYVPISNMIFDKVSKPSFVETRVFWKELCQSTHATIFCGQASFSPEEVDEIVAKNYVILLMLLSCSHHLLSQHMLSPSIRYYLRRYNLAEELPKRREAAKHFHAKIRQMLNPMAKKLIREYCARWTIRS